MVSWAGGIKRMACRPDRSRALRFGSSRLISGCMANASSSSNSLSRPDSRLGGFDRLEERSDTFQFRCGGCRIERSASALIVLAERRRKRARSVQLRRAGSSLSWARWRTGPRAPHYVTDHNAPTRPTSRPISAPWCPPEERTRLSGTTPPGVRAGRGRRPRRVRGTARRWGTRGGSGGRFRKSCGSRWCHGPRAAPPTP